MASKKNFFEQKIKESHPDFDPTAKEPKPVGQREWTPTNDHRGAHTTSGYKSNVGGGGRTGPPPKKSLTDLP